MTSQEDSKNVKPLRLFEDPDFMKKLRFLSQHLVFCLVSKEVFDAVPDEPKSYAARASKELLNAISNPLGGERRDFYLFSSQTTLFAGIEKLKESSRFSDIEFTSINTTPIFFFEWLVDHHRGGKVFVDYSSKTEFLITDKTIGPLGELALYARLAAMKTLYVAQQTDGFAVPIDIEDKAYSLAFLSTEDALSAIAELQKDYPGCKLASNNLREMIRKMLDSEFYGIVIHPGTEQQVILSRRKLEGLLAIIELLYGPGTTFSESIRKFFMELLK